MKSKSGHTKAVPIFPVANALIKYIRRKRPDQVIVLHRDRDFLTAQELEDYETRIGDDKTRVFIPEKNDLEAFFLRENHFLTVYPEFNSESYKDIIDAAIAKREKSRTTRKTDKHQD